MMATATRFDPAKYAAMTTPDPSKISDDPNDVTGMIGLADLPKLLRDQYSPVACHKWRSRGSDEGGYGPVGTPAPDKVVSRGGAAAQPYWYPWTLERWFGQTGRRNIITRKAQQPRRPGRGRPGV
jgi:hypothetical protein